MTESNEPQPTAQPPAATEPVEQAAPRAVLPYEPPRDRVVPLHPAIGVAAVFVFLAAFLMGLVGCSVAAFAMIGQIRRPLDAATRVEVIAFFGVPLIIALYMLIRVVKTRIFGPLFKSFMIGGLPGGGFSTLIGGFCYSNL